MVLILFIVNFCCRRTPPIDPEILRTMVVKDFIGHAPNPGNRLRNQVNEITFYYHHRIQLSVSLFDHSFFDSFVRKFFHLSTSVCLIILPFVFSIISSYIRLRLLPFVRLFFTPFVSSLVHSYVLHSVCLFFLAFVSFSVRFSLLLSVRLFLFTFNSSSNRLYRLPSICFVCPVRFFFINFVLSVYSSFRSFIPLIFHSLIFSLFSPAARPFILFA